MMVCVEQHHEMSWAAALCGWHVVASTASVDTEHVQCVILDLCLVGNDPGVMTIARRVVLHGGLILALGSEGNVGYPEWIHELHCVPAAPCAWCSACDARNVAFSNSRVVDSLSASCMHLVDRVAPLGKVVGPVHLLVGEPRVQVGERGWAKVGCASPSSLVAT